MEPSVAAQFIVLFILLILSAFFSSAETALTTVSKLRIRALIEEGNKRAKLVGKLTDEQASMLSSILVGNNIVNLSASALTTSIALSYGSGIIVSVATGVLTLLILIFGEITPKTLATIHAEKLALLYAPVIRFFVILFTPIVFIVNKISFGIMYIFGTDIRKTSHQVTEGELRTMVDVSHEEGVIESDEHEMITNVVDFGDSLVKDICIPRVDMCFADDRMSYDELMRLFKRDKYSRLPVYSETKDSVIGIINLKDVFLSCTDRRSFNIKNLMREPFFTYEFKKTSELLAEMREAHISIAIVLDEYGVTAGLITLEDLLEEIVGEIRDEYDNDEIDAVREIGENTYSTNGTTKLGDINEAFGLDLESDDYDSIAGHIIHELGHLPTKGDCITIGNITFTVASVTRNRIDTITITSEENKPVS